MTVTALPQVLIPKSASLCSIPACELGNRKDAGISLFPVWLWFGLPHADFPNPTLALGPKVSNPCLAQSRSFRTANADFPTGFTRDSKAFDRIEADG
jgi:hypothetical protein